MDKDELMQLIELFIAIFLFIIAYHLSYYICEILNLNFYEEFQNGSMGIDIAIIIFFLLVLLTFKLSKIFLAIKKSLKKSEG